MHCCLCSSARGAGCGHIGGPYICSLHPGIKPRQPANDSLRDRIRRGMASLNRPSRRIRVSLFILLGLAGSAFAGDDPGPDICLKASANFVLGQGAASTTVVPGIRAEFDGPLATRKGQAGLLRGFGVVELSGLPAQTGPSLSNLSTINTFEGRFGLYHTLADANVGSYRVTTSVGAEYGFASFLPNKPAPIDTFPSIVDAFVQFAETTSRSWIRLGYGRDQTAGDFGRGQIIIAAEVPLVAAKSVLWFGFDARKSIFHPADARQHDSVRIYTGVAIPELVAVLSSPPPAAVIPPPPAAAPAPKPPSP